MARYLDDDDDDDETPVAMVPAAAALTSDDDIKFAIKQLFLRLDPLPPPTRASNRATLDGGVGVSVSARHNSRSKVSTNDIRLSRTF